MGAQYKFWVVGVVLALSGGSASANFLYGVTRTAGTGPLTGYDILRFFVKIERVNNTANATGLQAVSATLSIVGPGKFKFLFADQNGDGILDADPTGAFTQSDADARNNNSNNGTFVRAGDPAAGFITTQVIPPNHLSRDDDHNGQPDPGFDPTINYANLDEFRLDGYLPIGGPPDTSAIDHPFGSLIAMAVVPTGELVFITGSVAADTGNAESFTNMPTVTPWPEPSALCFVGLAMPLLVRRRRSAA
jgi:hypothetical protein